MAAAKEHAPSGRRPSRRAGIDADEPPLAEEVDSILAELEELIHSAELALAAGKHRRQGEHVCTAMCMRIQSLEGMLAAPSGASGENDNLRGGEEFAGRGRPRNGRTPQENESDSEEESGEDRDQGGGPGNAEPRRDWSEVFNEKQRESLGSLVARLPAIVKRFAQSQRARVCDVADNLMQALDLPLVMQEHKPKKADKGTPPWVKPKLQTPEGLQELVTIARENKFCSYEEVVKQIQQANRIIRKKLGADDGSGSDDHAQGGEPCAETWSILLTCPVTLTRMQVPARSLACKHLECFDLLPHLQRNASTHLKQWHCPICKKSATWNELIVDKYVEKLLADAPPDASELVIRPDASWAVKSAAETLEKLGFLREFVNLADSSDDSDSDEEVHSAKATLSPFKDQPKSRPEPPSPISKLRSEPSDPVPERIAVEVEGPDEEEREGEEAEVRANPPGHGVTSAGQSVRGEPGSRPPTPGEGNALGSGFRYAARLLKNLVSPSEKATETSVEKTGRPAGEGEPARYSAPDPLSSHSVTQGAGGIAGKAAPVSKIVQRISVATPGARRAQSIGRSSKPGTKEPGVEGGAAKEKQRDLNQGKEQRSVNGQKSSRPFLPVGQRELAGLETHNQLRESRLREMPKSRKDDLGDNQHANPEKAVEQSAEEAQPKRFGWGGARVKGSGSGSQPRAEKTGTAEKRNRVGGSQAQRKRDGRGGRRMKGTGQGLKQSSATSSVNTDRSGRGGDAGATGGGVGGAQRGAEPGREMQGTELSRMARHLEKARQRKETPKEGGGTAGLSRKRQASHNASGKPARKRRKQVSVNELARAGPRKRGRPPSGESGRPLKRNRAEGGSADSEGKAEAGVERDAGKAAKKTFPRTRDGKFAKVAGSGAKIVSKGRGWVSLATARAAPVKKGRRSIILESGNCQDTDSDSDVPIARLLKGTTPGKGKGTAGPTGSDEGLGEGFGKRVRKQSVRLGEPVSAAQSSRSGGGSGFGPGLGVGLDSGFWTASGFGPGGLPNDANPVQAKVNLGRATEGGKTPESAPKETSGRGAESGTAKPGRESGERIGKSAEPRGKAPSEAGRNVRAVDKSTLAILEALSRTEQKREEYLRKQASEPGGADTDTAGRTPPEQQKREEYVPKQASERGGPDTAGRTPPEQQKREESLRKQASERGGVNTAAKTPPEQGTVDPGCANTSGKTLPEQGTGESRSPASRYEVPLPEASNVETQQEEGVQGTDWEAVFRAKTTPPEVSGAAGGVTIRGPESSVQRKDGGLGKRAEEDGADSVGRKGEAQKPGLAAKAKEGSAQKGVAGSGGATVGAAKAAVSLDPIPDPVVIGVFYSCETIEFHSLRDGGTLPVAGRGTVYFQTDCLRVELLLRRQLGLPPQRWSMRHVGPVMGFKAKASGSPCQERIVIAVVFREAQSPGLATQGVRQQGADPAFILFEIDARQWSERQATPNWMERITFVDVEVDAGERTGSPDRDVTARKRRDALRSRAYLECRALEEASRGAPPGPASPDPIHTTSVSAPEENAPVTPVARTAREQPAEKRTSKAEESPQSPQPPSPFILPDTFRLGKRNSGTGSGPAGLMGGPGDPPGVQRAGGKDAFRAESRARNSGNGSEPAGGQGDPPGAFRRILSTGDSLKEGGAQRAGENDSFRAESRERKSGNGSEPLENAGGRGGPSGPFRRLAVSEEVLTKDGDRGGVRKGSVRAVSRERKSGNGSGPAGGVGGRGAPAGALPTVLLGGESMKEGGAKGAVGKDEGEGERTPVRDGRTAKSGPERDEARREERKEGAGPEEGGGSASAERGSEGVQKDSLKSKKVSPAKTSDTAPPRFNSNRLRVGNLTVRQGTVRFTRDALKVSLVHRKPDYWSEQLEWPLDELGLGYASLFPSATGGNDLAVVRLALKRGVPQQIATRLGTTVQDAGPSVVVFELHLGDWRKVESFSAWRGSCEWGSSPYASYLRGRRDENEESRDWLWKRDAEWFEEDLANRRPLAQPASRTKRATTPADAVAGKGSNRDVQPGETSGAQQRGPSARGKAARAPGESSPPLTRGQRAASLGDLNIDPRTEVIDLTLDASDGEEETVVRKERKRRRAN